jgi:hypothetical protein
MLKTSLIVPPLQEIILEKKENFEYLHTKPIQPQPITRFELFILSHDPLGGQLEDSWKRQWVTLGGADTWRVLV